MSITATGGPLSSRPCATRVAGVTFSSTLGPPAEAAGRGFLERFSASGEAWVGHEVLVRVERFFAGRRLDPLGRTVRQQLPALLIVLQICKHDLVDNLF